jgi:hypothetical protein
MFDRPKSVFAILIAGCLLSGCVATPYTLVTPGPIEAGNLTVTPADSWNQSSTSISGRDGSLLWTRDGLLLDRLVIIPDVMDGEPVFEVQDDSAALPPFRADMLPNEVAELVESSIVKLFGEGEVSVETSGLRPEKFGSNAGMLFELAVEVSDGPNYHGLTGAFISSEKLYLVIFLGAQPYYFDKHRESAEKLIKSARLTTG